MYGERQRKTDGLIYRLGTGARRVEQHKEAHAPYAGRQRKAEEGRGRQRKAER
jgi:hypothetical protein